MKSFKFSILVAMLLLTSHFVPAKVRETKNALTVSLGMGQNARQDLVFSPFIHSSLTVLNGGLEYSRNAALFRQIKPGYAGYERLLQKPYEFREHNEVKTAGPHFLLYLDIDYLFGKKSTLSSKSDLTTGGMFSTNIHSSNYVYARIGNFGYYSTIGIGIFGEFDFSLNEQTGISIRLQVPAISWLARSPYLVNDDEFIENISSHNDFKSFLAFLKDGGFATWNTLQYFDFAAKYLFNLSPQWTMGLAWFYEFIHAEKPRNFLSHRNSLNVSIALKF